jgi:predicted N-acetyltransferase YhbS
LRISYLADVPDLARELIPGLLDHWRFVLPDDTAASRVARFRAHENRDSLPIAWIAHSEEEVLGTAALRATDLPGRENLGPWLGGVYVSPTYRGRGIAKALCQTVEAKALEMGFPRLYLFTLDTAPLYARLGWLEIEQSDWRGHGCVLMSKSLGPV